MLSPDGNIIVVTWPDTGITLPPLLPPPQGTNLSTPAGYRVGIVSDVSAAEQCRAWANDTRVHVSGNTTAMQEPPASPGVLSVARDFNSMPQFHLGLGPPVVRLDAGPQSGLG